MTNILSEAIEGYQQGYDFTSGEWLNKRERNKRKEEADIAYKKSLTSAQQKNMVLKEQAFEQEKLSKQFNRLVDTVIEPRVAELKRTNAPQEKWDEFNSELKKNYPFTEKIYPGFKMARRKNYIAGSFMAPITKKDLPNYVSPNAPLYSLMEQEIQANKGSALFRIDVDENGQLRADSLTRNKIDKYLTDKSSDIDSDAFETMLKAYHNVTENDPTAQKDSGTKNSSAILDTVFNFLTQPSGMGLAKAVKNTSLKAKQSNVSPQEFTTEEDALNAKLPKGTVVIISGRKAKL